MMTTRAYTALLCGLFGIALICAYSVGAVSRSIWYDEAITLQTLSSSQFQLTTRGFTQIADIRSYFDGTTSAPALVQRYAQTDVHPPLYFLAANAATWVFGNSLIVARGVSVVIVALSVWLYWRVLVRTEIRDPWVYMAVYALSFAAVSTAPEARGYGLVLLLSIVGWAFAASVWVPRKGLWQDIGLGLVCAGLLYTHYFALFVVAPLLAWRFFAVARSRSLGGFIAPLICLALFAPWVPVLLTQMTTRPEQMTGFSGIISWLKLATNLIPAQIFSTSHPNAPPALQDVGRDLVLLLMMAGAARIMWGGRQSSQFAWCAIWVPAIGLGCFMVVSIILDRRLETFRYFLFFAPFLTFLAAQGVLFAGSGLTKIIKGGPDWVRLSPAFVLIALQCATLNFGWEANNNRGGNYFLSMRDEINEAGPEASLTIIDAGRGRGTLLSAAYTLPPEAHAYILEEDTSAWADAALAIRPLLQDRTNVLLIFSIQRGAMGSDKAMLYTPITDMLAQAGFARMPAAPEPAGGRHYARWIRTD